MNNNAPKDGEVIDNMVKAAGPIRIREIYRIRRKIWKSNLILDEYRKGVIVLMYEKAKTSCYSYGETMH